MGTVLDKLKQNRGTLIAHWEAKGPVKRKWLVLAAIVAVLLIAVIFMSRGRGGSRSSVSYLEAPVERRTIVSTLTGGGTLLPANSYTVTTLVEGDILTAGFEEGDMVAKDTVLYEIDSSDAANNIEKSQISLNQAQRNYDDAVDSGNIKAHRRHGIQLGGGCRRRGIHGPGDRRRPEQRHHEADGSFPGGRRQGLLCGSDSGGAVGRFL